MNGVSGVDYQLRLCVIQMSAFVFDDAVVIFLERLVAFDRDNRVDRYPRRDGIDARLEQTELPGVIWLILRGRPPRDNATTPGCP